MYKLFFSMHTCCRSPRACADAAGRRGRAPSRASRSPAPPATPARNCSACWRGIRRCGSPLATSSGAASAARRLPALGAALGRRDHAARAGRAGARSRRRVPGAARHGGGRAGAGAGRRRASASSICRARSGCATPRVRGRWYPETARCPPDWPTGSPSASATPSPSARLVANPGCYPTAALLALVPLADAGLLVPGADIIVDAKSGVSGAGKTPSERTHFSEVHGSLSAYGVFGHRHGAEIEQGLGRHGHVHAAPACRSIAASSRRSTCGWRRARPRRRSATSIERAYAARAFVRLVGAALPEIKHVAHTNFCDIGWRVDPSGRVDPRVGHRQPAEGRVGPGRAEHERDARPPRDDRTAVTGQPVVVKFGGELLEEPATARRRSSRRMARIAGAQRRSSSCTAAARKSTRR